MGLSFVRFSIPCLLIAGYENFCEDAMIYPAPQWSTSLLESKQTS